MVSKLFVEIISKSFVQLTLPDPLTLLGRSSPVEVDWNLFVGRWITPKQITPKQITPKQKH